MSAKSNDSNTRALHVRLCQFGGGFLFAGIAGVAFLQSATVRLEETAGWPSVTGRIIASEETTGVVKTGRVIRVTDVADVRYAYTVNGQRYECDGYRVLPMLHSSEDSAAEIVARYPVGMQVAVYYDPEDPADALLKPKPEEGVPSLVRTFTFFAGFLGVLGFVMLASGVMHIRAGDRAQQLAAIEARRPKSAPAAAPTAAAPAAAASPAPASVAARRPTHWLFRLAATVFGLFLLLMGSLLAVTTARTSNPAVSRAVELTCLVLFAGIALVGAYLVTRGMRRPSVG